MKFLTRALFVSTEQSHHFGSMLIAAFLLLMCCILPAQAAPGDLDSSFDTDGKVTTTIGSTSIGQAVAIQPDGKIIVAGTFTYYSNTTTDGFALARYNIDGSLDPTFGTTGIVTTDFGNSVGEIVYALALQPDGKIIAAGTSISNGLVPIAMARYNPDGSLDANFGTNGKVITAVGTYSEAHAVDVLSDGKIVVAGDTYVTNGSDFLVARYYPNGSLDTTFNNTGIVTTSVETGYDFARAMAIQSDGKIVAAGSTRRQDSGTDNDVALVRYNADGSLDTTFNLTGKVITPIGSDADSANAMALQPDGKIVVAGDSSNGVFTEFALVRYNFDGSLDTGFNGTGKVTTTVGNGNCQANAVSIQPAGKIIAAGYGTDSGSSNYEFALARYNPDATLDPTFGIDGKIITPIGSGNDIAFGLAIQPDGKIVAAGYTSGTNNDNGFALTRYLGDSPSNTAAPGSVMISELRLRGTAGANDEFIELYNNTDAGIAVSSADGSNGWSIVAANGTVRYTVPFNTIIPARGHYLVANNNPMGGYSLSNHPSGSQTTAVPDGTYTTDITDNSGIALYRTANPANFSPANVLDAVGFGATPAPYSEGTPLNPVGTMASGEYSLVRKVPTASGIPQDTNDNAADFVLVATDAGIYGTQTAVLGSPGPENRFSPVVNNRIAISLVDPLTSRLAAPNFVRNGSGNTGTLAIRRHFTNQTGTVVTRLRFRVYDITTLNTPVLAPPQADLRLTDSMDQTVSTTLGPVTVKGTQLEQPPTQAMGGGLNTSMTVQLPNGGLNNGDSLDVQFLMNVVVNGRFRFFFTVEALP